MSRVYYPNARVIMQVVFDGFGGDDSKPKIIPIIPKRLRIVRNSYKQADSWEVTFEANDFPLDPNLVRAGSLAIYLFQSDKLEDRRLMYRGAGFEDLQGDRPPATQSAQENQQQGPLERFTLGNKPVIAGLFDQHDLEMSGSGKEVTIGGQDYSAALAARQWPPTKGGRPKRVKPGARIDKTLAIMLAEADTTGTLQLVVRGVRNADLPTVNKKETRAHKRGIPIEQSTSYWDVMSELAARHGLILFVRGIEVILTRPQNLTSLHDGRVRRMAWGHNLTSLKLTRHLGKEKTPRIIIKAYDEETRERITVSFPPKKEKQADGTLGVAGDEFKVVPVYGITDPAVLAQMAEGLFHLLGRGERKVTFQTNDLRDMNETDIMDLAAGDSVRIEWREFSKKFLRDPSVNAEQKRQHLVNRGFGNVIAQIIVQTYEKLEFLERPMRVREATISFDQSTGVQVEGQLQDFVVIDGVRDPANRKPRKDKRAARYRDPSGEPIGNREIERT